MSTRSLLRSFFGRSEPADSPPPGQPRLPSSMRPHLVESHTRTFWSTGAATPATLVEADASAAPPRPSRAATLVAGHEGQVAGGARPRANPAFSEAIFVELMRARQYRRAFALLSPECQQSWGSLEPFVAAQRIGALATLRGVRVIAVRQLTGWRDPDSGMVHEHAAELDVEYAIGNGERGITVPRTVHLVAHQGAWRSLCYPTAPAG